MRELREIKGMTLEQLSNVTGISVERLEEYECYRRDVMKEDIEIVVRICNALEVSVECFLLYLGRRC